MVSQEKREIIKRMRERTDMGLGEIAVVVGLAGRKYAIFQEVCRQEGIPLEKGA